MRAGIVGAGIMGQLLALQLVTAGWDVVIFDANKNLNCSMVAAGLLTPFSELVKNDLIICELGMQALTQYWPAVIRQLQQPVYFQNQGSLLLAHPKDQRELTQFISLISNKLQASSYVMQHYIKSVNPSELEPELIKVHHGYYFAAEGCMDNQTLLQALQQHLRTKAVWHETTVTHMADGKIITEQAQYSFDKILDCRGLAAKNSFPDLRGVRGELIKVQAPEVEIKRPLRVLHPRYSLYIVPRPDAMYILGASEIDAEDNSPVSVKTLLELLSMAYWLHPGFAEARLIATLTHSRPTLPDQLPKIKYNDQFIAVNGLYRHGFLIAPTLAAEILLFLQSGLSAVHFPSLWEQIDDPTTAE